MTRNADRFIIYPEQRSHVEKNREIDNKFRYRKKEEL